MGIREKLNKNPAITTGVTIAIIVVALGFIVTQIVGGGSPPVVTEVYYTTDDGATYFADNVSLVPPYPKDGKDAVRAHVWRCAGGEPFVSHLERYNPAAAVKLREVQARLDAAGENAGPESSEDYMLQEQIQMTAVEVRKPGPDGTWISQQDPRAQEITRIACPDGTTNELEPVLPD